MAKPPLPSSSLKDALRLPAQFLVEALSVGVVAMSAAIFLAPRMGRGAFLATGLIGGALFLYVLARLVRKVIALRNERGPMRGIGLAAFWIALALPPLAFVIVAKILAGQGGLKDTQYLARIALEDLLKREVAFRNDFGKYTLSLKELGIEDSETPRTYALGFATACAVKEGLSADRSQLPAYLAPLTEARKLEVVEYFLKARNAEDCKSPKTGFEAFAVGVLRENALLDVWMVDETGVVRNLRLGL